MCRQRRCHPIARAHTDLAVRRRKSRFRQTAQRPRRQRQQREQPGGRSCCSTGLIDCRTWLVKEELANVHPKPAGPLIYHRQLAKRYTANIGGSAEAPSSPSPGRLTLTPDTKHHQPGLGLSGAVKPQIVTADACSASPDRFSRTSGSSSSGMSQDSRRCNRIWKQQQQWQRRKQGKEQHQQATLLSSPRPSSTPPLPHYSVRGVDGRAVASADSHREQGGPAGHRRVEWWEWLR